MLDGIHNDIVDHFYSSIDLYSTIPYTSHLTPVDDTRIAKTLDETFQYDTVLP